MTYNKELKQYLKKKKMHGVMFNVQMHLYTIAYYYFMYDLIIKMLTDLFLSFQWWMGLTTMT